MRANIYRSVGRTRSLLLAVGAALALGLAVLAASPADAVAKAHPGHAAIAHAAGHKIA